MHPVAHIVKNEKDEYITHDLKEHLICVAEMASEFASKFKGEEFAYLSGIQHDFGKYLKEFQIYIRQETGFELNLVSQYTKPKPDEKQHAITGALNVVRNLNPTYSPILNYIISGHHTGLPNSSDLSNKLKDGSILDKTLNNNPPQLYDFSKDILCNKIPKSLNKDNFHLWIRMLFSCLVDADFLDTEKFMQPNKIKFRRANKIKYLLCKFNRYMKEKQKSSNNLPINKVRNKILECCRESANQEPGVFSLTVPTGGGKTLSSVSFALEHCKKYNKDRIIIAIPYTSIIEQTAKELKVIFGENNVLEHHSNLDPSTQSFRGKLACENWNYPIIVTTNVQLFESLFSNRTSRCRKLHNICNSVIILDESQMLPTNFLKPILESLKSLISIYNSTLLLCTATQPTLIGDIGSGQSRFKGFENVREIIPSNINLFEELKRTEINIIDKLSSWENIRDKLLEYSKVLCIVNTKKDCYNLCSILPEDTIYLSTKLCAEHRSDIISTIKKKLKDNSNIRVISTQLVEAGVDIDFPVVFRAIAGLDSIIQSAGRCNREGRLSKGDVFVFSPISSNPPSFVKQGKSCTEEIIRNNPELIDDICPKTFHTYFNHLYNKLNTFDNKKICSLLQFPQFQFKTASDEFLLIDNKELSIVVKYKDSQKLIDQIDENISRDLIRKLQRYCVNVREERINELITKGFIKEINGIYVQVDDNIYDKKYGLII